MRTGQNAMRKQFNILISFNCEVVLVEFATDNVHDHDITATTIARTELLWNGWLVYIRNKIDLIHPKRKLTFPALSQVAACWMLRLNFIQCSRALVCATKSGAIFRYEKKNEKQIVWIRHTHSESTQKQMKFHSFIPSRGYLLYYSRIVLIYVRRICILHKLLKLIVGG